MADLEKFRNETRAWLEANCPPDMRAAVRGRGRPLLGRTQRRLQVGGAAPLARTDGGARLDRAGPGRRNTAAAASRARKRGSCAARCAALGCRSPLNSFGIWMLGPALLRYGSEAQKREYLPQIARGEIRWCQGYSEPDAGSDLASLATRAEDRGDHFLVNGQKIWTCYADKADWIFCLVRTDPAATKHQRHQLPALRHEHARRVDPADPADLRQVAVLRDLLRRRARARRASRRRAQQGLGQSPSICSTHEREMIGGIGDVGTGRPLGQVAADALGSEARPSRRYVPARRHRALRGRQRGLSVRSGADRRPAQSQAGQSGHLLDAQILRRRTEQAPS